MKNCLLDRLGQMPKRLFFRGNFHVFDPNQLTNITKGELEKYFYFLGTLDSNYDKIIYPRGHKISDFLALENIIVTLTGKIEDGPCFL